MQTDSDIVTSRLDKDKIDRISQEKCQYRNPKNHDLLYNLFYLHVLPVLWITLKDAYDAYLELSRNSFIRPLSI